MAQWRFFDAEGEEGLPVSGEVLTKLCNFVFALVECLTHQRSILSTMEGLFPIPVFLFSNSDFLTSPENDLAHFDLFQASS